LPPEAKSELDQWIEYVRSEGIVSLICFVSEKELDHYQQLLPMGMSLIDYYKTVGFQVYRIPWSDPAHSGYVNFQTQVEEKRTALLEAYDQLPKPILVHCSAAIDRSPPVIAYVVLKRTAAK
jgi:protein-tyrosine phosphatase